MRKELEEIGLEPSKAESLELVICLFLNGKLPEDTEESLRLFGHYVCGLAEKLTLPNRIKFPKVNLKTLESYANQTIKNKQYIEENQKLLEMEELDESRNSGVFPEQELNTAQEESLDNSLAIPPMFDRRTKQESIECRICGAASENDICGECRELGYDDDSESDNDSPSDSPDSGQGARLEPVQPVNPRGSPPAQAIPLELEEKDLAF